MGNTKEDTKTLDEILSECGIASSAEEECKLVIWNDDVNSFEWIISCLISLLNFSFETAENTAWTIHLKGKDVVKSGSKNTLLPYKKLLEERGLAVTIE